ncbi:MAG: YkgJ family cysteine cluster protein [Bacteroidetes bacterium]|nr:MAG: YkgJ family cysteine cluster protein [Bacteroidota bacterium]TAF92587.1 MAG: YkgJ family cysteine cluster protein [Bacteroidota bacterium]
MHLLKTPKINLASFTKKARLQRPAMLRFIKKLEQNTPKQLKKWATEAEQHTWQQIDCTSCANCCKKMTPTFTPTEIKNIAAHVGMTAAEFTEKWLYQHKGDTDWVNKTQPCQFLDSSTNLCTIYEVRPKDCAQFPHLHHAKPADYLHIHKQNIQYCPASFTFIEELQKIIASTDK